MSEELTTVAGSAAAGGVVAWLVSRVLNKPEQTAEKVNALEMRVVKIESRIGSDSDVGTIMHVLTEMQQAERETQQMLRDILSRLVPR